MAEKGTQDPAPAQSESASDNQPPKEFGIYVSDIARGTTDEQLREEFNKLAKVFETTVVKNKHTGETKGFGFVRFYTMEDVNKVLESNNLPVFTDKINGKLQQVKVTLADPKNCLYIGNIPRTLEEAKVKELLEEMGKVTVKKFELHLNAEGKSKGFGWATYADHDVALQVVKTLAKVPIAPGRFLNVSLAEPRVVDQKALSNVKILFVKNVASHVTKEALTDLFGGDVLVEKVVIPLDSIKRVPLGHAFIHFHNREQAEHQMNALNNYELEGRNLTIEWCLPPSATKSKRGPPGAMAGRGGRGRGPPSALPPSWPTDPSTAYYGYPGMYPSYAAYPGYEQYPSYPSAAPPTMAPPGRGGRGAGGPGRGRGRGRGEEHAPIHSGYPPHPGGLSHHHQQIPHASYPPAPVHPSYAAPTGYEDYYGGAKLHGERGQKPTKKPQHNQTPSSQTQFPTSAPMGLPVHLPARGGMAHPQYTIITPSTRGNVAWGVPPQNPRGSSRNNNRSIQQGSYNN